MARIGDDLIELRVAMYEMGIQFDEGISVIAKPERPLVKHGERRLVQVASWIHGGPVGHAFEKWKNIAMEDRAIIGKIGEEEERYQS